MRKQLRDFLMKTVGGRKIFQKLFENLFYLSSYGMNFGYLYDFNKNGERLVVRKLKEYFRFRQPAVIFDVGANVGDYSSMLLKEFKGETLAKLFAFEPSKSSFMVLKQNIGYRADLFNIGFSNKKENKFLYSQCECSGQASLYKRNLLEYGVEMNNKEKITLDTIDNFCNRHHIENIDFLKIDVEGHELKVLQGAKGMMAKNSIDIIQFETGCNSDVGNYFKDFFYLLNTKYKIYRILRDGLLEIKKYHWLNEISSGANYLAVRRTKND
jgi:FkbM family methyltransferase